MTVTRLWQAGAEWQDTALEFSSVDDPLFTYSSTQKNTGGYAFRTEDKHYGRINVATTYTQLRVGFWVKHSGVVGSQTPRLVSLRDSTNGDADVLQVRWDGANSELEIYSGVGGTLLGSVVSSTFAAGGWVHIGLDVKFHASAGWAYLYVDGIEVISFDGDTTQSGTAADGVLFGGVQNANNQWNQYLYLDDLYIDSLTSESAPAVVPVYRFDFVYPNGAGVHDGEFVGSDGNSVDNYLLVDEQPHDSDTTYIKSDTPGNNESTVMMDITLPSGWQVNAVLPQAVARKTETGSTLGAKLYTRTTVSGTPYFATSAHFDLSTAYGLIWERRALRPDSGAWDEASVDALEIGILVD